MLALVLALAVVACGGETEPSGGGGTETTAAEGAAPFEGKTFKIGNLSSYSGPLSAYGQPIGNALHLAADEVNARGGLLGAKIEIIDADTQSDAKVAVDQARKLLQQDKVDVMFGVEGSYLRDAIMPVVEQHKKILLYPANYEGEKFSEHLFVLGMTPTQEFSEDIGKFLLEEGGKKWYLMAADYVATVNINKYVEHELMPKLGAELVGCASIPLDQNDFGPTIQRIKDADPDVIVNNLIGAHTIPFQQQLAAAGITPENTLMEGTAYQSVTIEGMGDTAEGAYRSTSWNDDVDTPVNKEFVKNYKAKFPDVPAIYISEAAYNSVLALEAAVKKAKSLETDALITGLEGVTIDAPSGQVTIRPEDHHAALQVFLTQVKGGVFETVDQLGAVSPSYDQHEEKFGGLEKCG
jgi:ABC-type branched-subunit amino acid transport system substrate-binding protein